MDNYIISIFSNKTFLEIVKEIKFFDNIKFEYYENLDLCITNAEKGRKLVVFFEDEINKEYLSKIKKVNFPLILITKPGGTLASNSWSIFEKMHKPFSIVDFKKNIVSLIAKYEFNENSLINLNNYIIDKNERKIKKNNLELQLSEKEVNFLILFSKSKEPIKKSLVLESVWNYAKDTETHTVETHIHRLRKKIFEKFGDNNFIKNNNKGYFI